MEKDKIISTLNDLIETCIDSENGFREAANNVKSPQMNSMFLEIANERKGFASELKREVLAFGGDPETTGSTGAAVHRAWMSVVGSLTGKSEHNILVEAERGEDAAVGVYEKAMKEAMPSSVRDLIDRQFRSVKQSHDRIKQMRDAKSATMGK